MLQFCIDLAGIGHGLGDVRTQPLEKGHKKSAELTLLSFPGGARLASGKPNQRCDAATCCEDSGPGEGLPHLIARRWAEWLF